jgi:hypothetical protein
MTGEKDMFTSFQPSHDQSGNIVLVTTKKKFSVGVKLLSQMTIQFSFTCEFVEMQLVIHFTTL